MRSNKVQIGIIGAMQVEIDGITALMANKEIQTISGIEFISGELYGKRIVAAVCGIGKVFAAVCAQTMILCFEPDVIINSGVAGTLTDELSIGDAAVASSVVQHDMDTTAIGDEPGLISGINVVYIPTSEKATELLESCVRLLNINVKTGTIATGDCFINDTARKNEITEKFGAIACEMEGAAIGQVCYINGVNFSVLRAISDGGDENSSLDYPAFVKLAASRSIEIMKRFAERWDA